MLALVTEARIYRPDLTACFVLNRCGARTVLARETAETLARRLTWQSRNAACLRPVALLEDCEIVMIEDLVLEGT